MNDFIDVFVYYWKTIQVKSDYNYKNEIRMYGLNENNENVCIRVDNCKTRVILEFTNYEYLEENFNSIKSKLSQLIYNREDKNYIKLVYKHKLYWCYMDIDTKESKTFPFIEIFFSSKIGLYSFKKKVLQEKFGSELKLHELQSTTELQMMIERNIDASGWICVKNPTPVDTTFKETKCKHEYYIDKYQILASNKIETVDVKIMAWDIEAKCKNIGKNPGEDIEDCVFQISCIFYNLESRKMKKKLLTLGECDNFDNDTHILTFECEKDLILGFVEQINCEQPNILTGWNIFNFDFKFMIKRAEHNQCLGEFLSFGMSIDQCEINNVKWYSKATLNTNIEYIDAEGILSLDLIEIVRKDYKLESYSLNNVAKTFLTEQKDDISFTELMDAYKSYSNKSNGFKEKLTKVGKYCVQDSKLVLDLFVILQIWFGIVEMSKTTSTQIMNVHLNGQQKKFYNQIFKYCYKNNIVVESDGYKSDPDDKYTGAWVFDPKPGIFKYVIPFDFESLYPSIIIFSNICFTTIIPNNSKFPEEWVNTFKWEDHIGCEHDESVIRKNILIEYIRNIDLALAKFPKEKNYHSLLESKKKYASEKTLLNKKLSRGIKLCKKNEFKFIKREIYEGIVPKIIQNLLNARKIVKKQMEVELNPIRKNLLNQRQLSYKISANSMYGALGVKSGALPFMPLAMCVTHVGRESIQKAAQILLKDLGGNIVYGDTDSNYVTFSDVVGTHDEICCQLWDRAISAAKIISSHFPKPMNIEFENKIFYKFLILTKKRYMFYTCFKNGVIDDKLKHKGVLLAKRDYCKFTKCVYEKTVDDVFDDSKNLNEILNNIVENILDLFRKNVDPKLLTISKSVNDYNNCEIEYNERTKKYNMGNYIVPKPPSDLSEQEKKQFCVSKLPAQVQLEIKQIEKGSEKSSGSRLEYLVIRKNNATLLRDKVVQYNTFCSNSDIINIDFMYYVVKLIDPLEQIISSVFGTDKCVEKCVNQIILKDKLLLEIKKLFKPKFIVTSSR